MHIKLYNRKETLFIYKVATSVCFFQKSEIKRLSWQRKIASFFHQGRYIFAQEQKLT
jgi:hypothetical protein